MAQKKKAAGKTTAKRPAAKKAVAKRPAAKKTAVKKSARAETAPKTGWIVTTSAERPIAEVAKELAKAGFAIERTLDQIGVITGKSDEQAAGKVRAIRGVADVSPETRVDIGPPNSRDTW